MYKSSPIDAISSEILGESEFREGRMINQQAILIELK